MGDLLTIQPIEIALPGHLQVSASADTPQEKWSAKAEHWPQAQEGDFQSPPVQAD